MREFDYVRPQNLDELTVALRQKGSRIIAGGTDIIPQIRRNLLSASFLIDVSGIEALRFIEEESGWIKIGAMTTHQEIMNAPVLQKHNPALVAAAASVGCDQTRNRGTLGGNIANASPAGDLIPPLMAFDAEIVLKRSRESRTLSLNQFIVGPGKTQLQVDEFIHSVNFAELPGAWGASFLKLGKRNGMAISVVNAAAVLILDSKGKVEQARIALGSVAPIVLRCSEAEAFIVGKLPTDEIVLQTANLCVQTISPISDVRASAAYRRMAAVVLARRALAQALAGAQRSKG